MKKEENMNKLKEKIEEFNSKDMSALNTFVFNYFKEKVKSFEVVYKQGEITTVKIKSDVNKNEAKRLELAFLSILCEAMFEKDIIIPTKDTSITRDMCSLAIISNFKNICHKVLEITEDIKNEKRKSRKNRKETEE